MRPDYTLSLWQAGKSDNEAEAAGEIAHVHFDAKYRALKLKDLVGDSEAPFSDEWEEERGGEYVRGDLLKMHAYKDAIRRSVGAYVLYPGSEGYLREEESNSVPSVGAFPLRPGTKCEEDLQSLGRFLRRIATDLVK